MSAELEEGLTSALDFEKLTSVAATGQALLPVVLQHADSRDVLFVGYVNRLAVEISLIERTAVLWSTSRNELWRKGATSGDVLALVDVRVNCEQNSVLYLVRPTGTGVCHTRNVQGVARPTCYYRSLSSLDELSAIHDLT